MQEIPDTKRTDILFEKVAELIEQARKRVATTVNIAEVYTKYHIGQFIVEDEQQGEYRAQYGKQVLKNLSERLTERFGEGWSYSNLRQIRQFYLVYGNLTNGVCQIKKGKWCLPNSEAAYELCLPDRALLQAKVKEWIKEFEEQQKQSQACLNSAGSGRDSHEMQEQSHDEGY